jgi:elongation factor 1-gamma
VSLVFARQSQVYLLALSQNECNEVVHKETANALNNYLTGMNRALSGGSDGLVNNKLSIADICFVCEICQISRERAHIEKLKKLNLELIYNRKILNRSFEHAMRHFDNLCDRQEFSLEIAPLMDRLSRIADQAHGTALKD